MYSKQTNRQSWDARLSPVGRTPSPSKLDSPLMGSGSSSPSSVAIGSDICDSQYSSMEEEMGAGKMVFQFPRPPPSTHYLLWNLSRRPQLRNLIIWEKFARTVFNQKNDHYEDETSACLVQASGVVAHRACTSCEAEEGIFAECVFVKEYLGGSCAGCLYAGRVCSIGATSKFSITFLPAQKCADS